MKVDLLRIAKQENGYGEAGYKRNAGSVPVYDQYWLKWRWFTLKICHMQLQPLVDAMAIF